MLPNDKHMKTLPYLTLLIPGAILDTQMSVEFFVAFYSATLNIYISWYFFS